MLRFSPHALLFTLFCATSALAEEPAPRPTVLKLTVEKALELALAKNFSIQVQRFEPKIAREEVRKSLGKFDPDFQIRAERAEDTVRNVFGNGIRLETSDVNRVDRLTSGISGVTAWGTEYEIGYGTRSFTGTNNFWGDQFDTEGRVAITQPLLKGAGPAANLNELRIARNNVMVSEWQLKDRVIDIMTETIFIYNELQLSIENLAVAERSRELARQLFTDNQKRVEIGVASPLDVTEARAEVAAREEGVILAQRNILDNENLLKQQVTTDLMPLLGVRVEIAPPVSRPFQANVPAGVKDALELRPDYRQAILQLEQRHIRLAFQKNNLLPRIDLTGSLSLLGLDDDFGGSIRRVGDRDQTAWSAGVIFSIPLGNREARGSYNAAQLEVAKQIVALQELEQQIIVEVDNASGQIITARERIASTKEASRLAQESLDAGEERLRVGTGRTFEVLELQKRLIEAEAAELRARSDYNKAVSEYYRKTGTMLRIYNVSMQ